MHEQWVFERIGDALWALPLPLWIIAFWTMLRVVLKD